MVNATKLCLILLITYTVAFAPPVLVSDNPQSIYAVDVNDSWNRIFRVLFTRMVKARVSDAFPEGAPFESFQVRMGSFPIRLSKQKLSRTEIGDRAIEPLYPTFFTAAGPAHVLSDPGYTELASALREAIAETQNRPPIERALMQADVWAAYDIIHENGSTGSLEHRTTLLKLLGQFIRKLALSSDEIKSLKNNYVEAAKGNILPNLFSPESGWLEIVLLDDRSHDYAASFRRATRVFIKPRTTQSDPGQFVEGLKHQRHHDQVEAVALVIQNLLIDSSGKVVPSPVFTEVQFRFFKHDAKTGEVSATAQQFELSRKKLLTEPMSGGFVEYFETSPAYLAAAGNDLGFANTLEQAGAPVLVPLRTRCTQCHNPPLTTIMTYSIHYFPPVPTTRILKPLDQERAFYVARRKEERDDFKSLIR